MANLKSTEEVTIHLLALKRCTVFDLFFGFLLNHFYIVEIKKIVWGFIFILRILAAIHYYLYFMV